MNSHNTEGKPVQAPPLSRRRRWYEGIYLRFAASFVVILAAIAIFNVFVTTEVWVTMAEDIEQRRNWNLAEQIALRLQPQLAQGVDEEWLIHQFFEFRELYPAARIFLLDAEGRIERKIVDREINLKADRIPLGTLIKATQPVIPRLPLMSFDPVSGKSSVFSTAKTTCEGSPCYIYVTLTAGLFDMLQDMQGQYYIVTYLLILSALGILMISSIAIGLFIFLSRGFRDMLSVVRSVEKGDFSRRIPIHGNDEIAEISRAINSMAGAVEHSIEVLANTDQQRRELVANISHDLRGPLTVIEGFLETIIRKGSQLTEEERDEHLQRIYRNVLQQKQLTSDLFELSKLEAQERTAQLEAFSILELVYDTAQKYQLQAAEKNMRISVNTTVDPGAVLADISMIDRVLSNLVSNAIRYCPPSTAIDLLVVDEGTSVRVEVKDNGEGIAPNDLLRIFESFYRVEKDRSRVTGGSGLGLAIVKKMLESNRSEVFVESEVGQGTRFYFSLAKAETGIRAHEDPSFLHSEPL